MDEARLLNILRKIPGGETIPGINPATKYSFAGIENYDSHGKAADFDGSAVVILHSNKRKRSRIVLFAQVLAYFLKDGRNFLSYGRLPPSYILEFKRGDRAKVPNLSEYETHYKSLARYIYSMNK